jgi:signal transduction histidine kinase
MPGTLRAWALPPSFADEEKTRIGRTLYVLSLGLMLMSTFSLAQSWVYGWTGAACTLGVENLCLIAALWFTHQGKTVWATKIICFSELVCGLLLTSVFGPGFKDEAILVFPLILVTAAVLLDWRSYVAFAGVVLVSVACSGFFLAQTGMGATRYHRVFNTLNILLVTAVATGLLARNLKHSVSQSREAEREIKALSARLINAQEEERCRLARELHDDVSQQIAAIAIGMSNLKRQIPTEQAGAREQSGRIQQNLAQISESIRRLSHELHPAVLELSGLGAALCGYCSEFGLLTNIRVSCKTGGSFEGVPSGVALCVYRITQEALQNVAKHARVAEAEVELTRTNGLLFLTIADHGAGMEPNRTGILAGLGLVSIKERTRLVNGTFEIQSQPNRGTALRVKIPV